jgi:hypothetical protein
MGLKSGEYAGRKTRRAPVGLDQLTDAVGLVCVKPVEGDHVALAQLGSETLLDVGFKGTGVHRAVQHHRSDDSIQSERCGDGDVVTPVFGDGIHGAFTGRCTCVGSGHREIDAGFVDEKQSSSSSHDAAVPESFAFCLDLGPVGFAGMDGFILPRQPVFEETSRYGRDAHAHLQARGREFRQLFQCCIRFLRHPYAQFHLFSFGELSLLARRRTRLQMAKPFATQSHLTHPAIAYSQRLSDFRAARALIHHGDSPRT